MGRPKIKITLVEQKGPGKCHRGINEIGRFWDYDTDRGDFCPMAMHSLFPMIDILRFGGEPPVSRFGDHRFCCPDAGVINIFKIETVEEE